MCNIAGYAGNRQAAPILLEMLRRQQDYDGGMSTGIVTYHEGRLYIRKIIGDVDALIKHTDALYLPGTIGIAHTRPSGTPKTYGHAQPFVTVEGNMAACTNGTGRGSAKENIYEEAQNLLEDNGYLFTGEEWLENSKSTLRNGSSISSVEVRLNMFDYYVKHGKSMGEAMAITQSQMYKDGVIVALNKETPDRIYALRTTRPMNALIGDNETLIATAQFAFPEDVDGHIMQLPLAHVCEITRDGVNITKTKLRGCEKVSDMTPYTYAEGYRRIVELLKGKKDEPLYFDDLEFAVWGNMKDLWPGDHTIIQDARLVYDVLYQLEAEGRLKGEVRVLKSKSGDKNRRFMWIEE